MDKEKIQLYKDYKVKLFNELEKSKVNDLFVACYSSDGYYSCWFRDCYFIVKAYLNNDNEQYTRTTHKILDVLKKFEHKYHKFSEFIKDPSDLSCWRLLHVKFDPVTIDEIYKPWNHLQRDSNALILMMIIDGLDNGLNIIRDDSDREIIQLFVDYILKIGNCEDASSWEENNHVRLSSIALTIKALKEIQKYGFIVDNDFVEESERLYYELFPFEHVGRKVDLTLLYLPYFDITNELETKMILFNVEKTLLKNKGVLRYVGDQYYMERGIEAPWSFGLSFLSIAYFKLGYIEVAEHYIDKLIELYPDGRIPELLIGGERPNENTPLSWSVSVQSQAIDKVLEYYGEK